MRTSLPGKSETPSCTCQSLSRGVSCPPRRHPPPWVPVSSRKENWEGRGSRCSRKGTIWQVCCPCVRPGWHAMLPYANNPWHPRETVHRAREHTWRAGSGAALQAGLSWPGPPKPGGGVVRAGEGGWRETGVPSQGQERATCSNLGQRSETGQVGFLFGGENKIKSFRTVNC